MKKITFIALLFYAFSAFAQSALKSAAWAGPDTPCGVYPPSPAGDLMPLDGAGNWNTYSSVPGAHVGWNPNQNMTVRKVCIVHEGNMTGASYAVVGHNGPNGDWVTPRINTTEAFCMSFDSVPVVFTGGEYFDIHAGCTSGSHHVILTIWYTQP